MKMPKLKVVLEDFIIQEMLTPQTCTQFYLEGIRVRIITVSV